MVSVNQHLQNVAENLLFYHFIMSSGYFYKSIDQHKNVSKKLLRLSRKATTTSTTKPDKQINISYISRKLVLVPRLIVFIDDSLHFDDVCCTFQLLFSCCCWVQFDDSAPDCCCIVLWSQASLKRRLREREACMGWLLSVVSQIMPTKQFPPFLLITAASRLQTNHWSIDRLK